MNSERIINNLFIVSFGGAGAMISHQLMMNIPELTNAAGTGVINFASVLIGIVLTGYCINTIKGDIENGK